MSQTRAIMFGRDHQIYGDLETISVAHGRTACAMSVGADRNSPSLLMKKYPDQTNEDALFAVDLGSRVLLAVADAHFGPEASHWLMAELDRCLLALPEDIRALDRIVDAMQPSPGPSDSESTLLVAAYDRDKGEGFGLCVGDSALFVVAEDGVRAVNRLETRFLKTDAEGFVRSAEPDRFFFFAPPGALLVACSDGVHECNYRTPERSIRPRHLLELHGQVGADPTAFAKRLGAMALRGVDGHPGGQDNVAIAVTVASGSAP